MMHRTQNGQLVEINKMHFKNDVACFAKIAELKQQMLESLTEIQFNVYTAEPLAKPVKLGTKDKID